MYRNIEIDPTIQYVDGKITEDSVDNLIEETQASFSTFDAAIGTDVDSLVSSIYPLIGMNKSDLIPNVAYGTVINGLSQVFTPNGKKYLLSAIPEDSSALVFSSGVYAYSPTTNFVNANEYTVVGRTIIFASDVSGLDFSVSYNGYIPDDYGADINFQSLFPNPKNIELGRVSKPIITEIDSVERIYSVIINEETYIPGVDEELSSPVPGNIDSRLSAYVSPLSDIDTPLDFASAWKLNTTTLKYEKIELEYLRILSEKSFVIKTKTLSLLSTDTVVISLVSKTIMELLSELYVAYKNHNHDSFGNTKKLSHSSIESEEDVDYHKQYLRKSGYTNIDKENLMLGDLFMSSTDSTTDNSNMLNRSRMIIFGDYAFGHTIYRETSEFGYLLIDGRSSNGLNIILEVPAEGTSGKNFLKSENSLFYNAKEVGSTKTSLKINGGHRLFLLADNGVDIETLEARLISIKENSVINVGGVKITGKSAGAEITTETGKKLTVNGDVEFVEATFAGATFKNGKVPLAGKITFTPTDDTLEATAEGPKFKNKILISDYANVSVVAEDNTLPLTISNVLKVEALNSVFFVRKISSSLTVNDKKYAFRETVADHIRIDRIQDWPRQSIFSKDITLDEVFLPDSDFSSRAGLKFGSTAKIYTSSADTVCSINSLVLESEDDVILLTHGDSSTDCETKQFAGLKVGNVTSTGSINSSGNVEAEGDLISENVNASGEITAEGNITSQKVITGASIKSTGELNVGGTSKLTNVIVSGELQINSLTVGGNGSISGDVSIGKSLAVEKHIDIGGNFSVAGSIRSEGSIESIKMIAELIRAEELGVAGHATISGNLRASGAEFNGNVISSGSVTAEVGFFKQKIGTAAITANDATFSRLIVEGKSNLKATDMNGVVTISETLSVNQKVTASGGLNVDGGIKALGGMVLTDGLEMSGTLKVSGDGSLSGNLSIIGGFDSATISCRGNATVAGSLDVSNLATIRNLEVSARADFGTISANRIYVGKAIEGGEDTSITIGSVTTSRITVVPRGDNPNDKIISYVDIDAMKNLMVANELTGNLIRAKSVFTLGNPEDENAVYLTTDGLHFAKPSSIVGAGILAVEKIIGRTSITSSELASFDSSIANGAISAIEASKFTIADNLSVEGILNVPRSFVCGGTIFFNKMVPLDPKVGYVDIVAGASVYE